MTALAYSPDGSRIYTASRSLQQRCWDVASARTLRFWKVGSCTRAACAALMWAIDACLSVLLIPIGVPIANCIRKCPAWWTSAWRAWLHVHNLSAHHREGCPDCPSAVAPADEGCDGCPIADMLTFAGAQGAGDGHGGGHLGRAACQRQRRPQRARVGH